LDDDALLPALEYRLRQRPHDLRLMGEIVALHERAGRPREAIAFLQRAAGDAPSVAELQMLADLAERAADIELARRT
ncbi:hypothetical protein AAHH78_42820, partial [Burkholderia pseudomallei]